MFHSTIDFSFDSSVPMTEVEGTLTLALLAVASLYGEDRVRLQTHIRVNRDIRSCVIDANTKLGRMVAIVFAGYLRREFGEEAVRVRHGVRARTDSGELYAHT